MFTRRLILTAAVAAVAVGATPAFAQDTIKIGEINSYSGMPGFTGPYKNGWQMALEEINAKGGVLGKKLEVIWRDDNAKPGEAVKIAEEMIVNDKVAMIGGTFLSHIGLAVTDLAARRKVFFLAAEPLADQVVWQKGNRYTFRLRASVYMQAAMLVDAASKTKAKRWATIAPNYAYGQDAVKAFISLLKEKRPDIEIVAQQWPALGRIDAGGYPWWKIDTPAHNAFKKAYMAKFKTYPRLGSIVGYTWMYAAAGIIQKAGSTDTEALIKAARGIKLESPMGPYIFRPIDQQSTLGAYVGLTTVENGKATMKDWSYADGAKYLPPDSVVKKLRPAAAMK